MSKQCRNCGEPTMRGRLLCSLKCVLERSNKRKAAYEAKGKILDKTTGARA